MISINQEAMKTVRRILDAPDALGVIVDRLPNGATVIDMGQRAPGGWVAGKYYTLITLGGLGKVSYEPFAVGDRVLSAVRVMIDQPMLACIASQIAGWRLEGARAGAPILAGPARALNQANPDHYFDLIDYRDQADEGVIAIQTAEPVTEDWAATIAAACRIQPENLYILVAPNSSLVCAIQVAARIVEQSLHRLAEEGFRREHREVRPRLRRDPAPDQGRGDRHGADQRLAALRRRRHALCGDDRCGHRGSDPKGRVGRLARLWPALCGHL